MQGTSGLVVCRAQRIACTKILHSVFGMWGFIYLQVHVTGLRRPEEGRGGVLRTRFSGGVALQPCLGSFGRSSHEFRRELLFDF